jgi:hypothetical protein
MKHRIFLTLAASLAFSGVEVSADPAEDFAQIGNGWLKNIMADTFFA